MPNQPFLSFPMMVTLVITLAGCLCGVFFGAAVPRLRWWKSAILLALSGAAAAGVYFWYGEAYLSAPLWTIYGAYLAVGWMMGLLMAFLPLFAVWLLSFFGKGRSFLSAMALFVFLFCLGAGVYGAVDGNERRDVDEIVLEVKGLPPAFDGFKIAQISDTHIGPYYRYASLDGDLFEAFQYKADVVAFTGDLIDDVRVMPETARILDGRSTLFPYGIDYIFGNHEYYRGKDYIESELKKTKVRILENDSTVIHKDGASLWIAGVDYPWGKKAALQGIEENLADKAFADIPEGAAVILLGHHSDFIDEGRERGAFLTLTGHTHGLQTGLGGQPIFPMYKYMRGMYSADGLYGYVNRGTGHWFPFRLGCSREMTIFTLKAK